MSRHEGKVGIVTGAARGIGRATAEQLAFEGARLVVADAEASGLAETAARIEQAGGEAIALEVDVSDSEQVGRMCATAEGTFGALHLVCSAAGVLGPAEPLASSPEEDFDRVLLAVNARGVWLVMKHAVPPMRASDGGSIVNIASAPHQVRR